jgi:hypothetical protein
MPGPFRLLPLFAALAIAALPLFLAPQYAAADEPVITYQWPEPEGEVFSEPLQVIQICFDEPIDVRDLPPLDEGDFEFNLIRPNGFSVGMRIVFQANGYGVAVYPGIVEETVGQWTLEIHVRDRATLDPLDTSMTWEVSADGGPIITPTPNLCPEGGGAPATNTPGPDATPSTASPTPEPGVDEDDDDPDVLLLSLLTIGAAGGAAVIALLGYVFRRRIGFWPHKPSDEAPGGDHH